MFPALLLVVTAAQAQDARILMLGNSYTEANGLEQICADALEGVVPPWTDVHALRLAAGGWTLADHAAAADGSQGDTEWRQALVSGPEAGSWDYVFLQDQSQIPGFPQDEAYWIESHDGALVLDDLIEAGNGATVFLLTWGRRDGDPDNPKYYPDFSTMQAHLTEGYLAYRDAASADGTSAWLVPAGLAFQRIYDDQVDQGQDPLAKGSLFHGLYQSDGSHPSPAGSYLTACTLAVALTGRQAEGIPFPADVDPNVAATLQATASATVMDDPFGAIPYPWAMTWDEYTAEQPAGSRVDIGDAIIRPLVRVDSGYKVETLTIGTQGDGELRVEGDLYVTDVLVVGSDGEGTLDQRSGSTGTNALVMAQDLDSIGTIILRGGRMNVSLATLGPGISSFLLDDGILVLDEGSLPELEQVWGDITITRTASIEGSYTWRGGQLSLYLTLVDETLLTVAGPAILGGNLVVEGGVPSEAGDRILISAESIDAGGLVAQIPDGSSLELRKSGTGQDLVLMWPGVDTDDTGTPTDTAPDDTILVDTGTPAKDERGCSCGTRRAGMGWMGLLLAGILGFRRRGSPPHGSAP